jgi:capsular polysaccharide biosynthesis protein
MSTAPTQPIGPHPLTDDDLPPEAPQAAPAARRGIPVPQPALTARGWIITIVCGLLFAGGAAIVALGRHASYTAESLMNVGAVNLRVQAQSGYTAGAEALASSYSRVAMSGLVERPVAAKLSLTPDEVSSRLKATPIPDEPQFKIVASGPTAADAIALADTATRQMQTYADQASTGRDSANTLLKRYQRQTATTARLRNRFFLLKGLMAESKVNGATPAMKAAAPSQAKLNRAEIAFNTAQLRAEALAGLFQVRIQEVGDAPRVDLLGRSLTAKSDRLKVLEELVVVGLLAGLLVGVAIALVVERFSGRRRARAATA